MRKKLTAMFAAIVCLLTACSPASQAEPDDGKVTLTIMGKKADMEKTYLQRIFRLYEQSGKGHLRVIGLDDADASYDAAVQEAFSSGEAPDILFHFNDSGLNALNVNEQFVCLDEEEWASDLTDGAKACCPEQ